MERLGLNPSNAASAINTKLTTAQSGGFLTNVLNDILEYTLGSAYIPLTATSMVTDSDVVMKVVKSAPPTMAPTSEKHNHGGNGDNDDAAIIGGVLGGLAGVGIIAVAIYMYSRAGVSKIAPT